MFDGTGNIFVDTEKVRKIILGSHEGIEGWRSYFRVDEKDPFGRVI